MPSWLITGTSRGIGLETVRQLAANPANTIFATCRNPSSADSLNEIAKTKHNVHVIALDVEDATSVQSAVDAVKKVLPANAGIDYLINNAGWATPDSFDDLEPERIGAILNTHVVGSFRVFKSFLPLVKAGERKVVVNVSSELGSFDFTNNVYGELYPAYAIAKAGMNMLSLKIAKRYPDLVAFSLGPGWIKTELGGAEATYDAEDAVARHLKLYESAKVETHSGKFINHLGEEPAW